MTPSTRLAIGSSVGRTRRWTAGELRSLPSATLIGMSEESAVVEVSVSSLTLSFAVSRSVLPLTFAIVHSLLFSVEAPAIVTFIPAW